MSRGFSPSVSSVYYRSPERVGVVHLPLAICTWPERVFYEYNPWR